MAFIQVLSKDEAVDVTETAGDVDEAKDVTKDDDKKEAKQDDIAGVFPDAGTKDDAREDANEIPDVVEAEKVKEDADEDAMIDAVDETGREDESCWDDTEVLSSESTEVGDCITDNLEGTEDMPETVEKLNVLGTTDTLETDLITVADWGRGALSQALGLGTA